MPSPQINTTNLPLRSIKARRPELRVHISPVETLSYPVIAMVDSDTTAKVPNAAPLKPQDAQPSPRTCLVASSSEASALSSNPANSSTSCSPCPGNDEVVNDAHAHAHAYSNSAVQQHGCTPTPNPSQPRRNAISLPVPDTPASLPTWHHIPWPLTSSPCSDYDPRPARSLLTPTSSTETLASPSPPPSPVASPPIHPWTTNMPDSPSPSTPKHLSRILAAARTIFWHARRHELEARLTGSARHAFRHATLRQLRQLRRAAAHTWGFGGRHARVFALLEACVLSELGRELEGLAVGDVRLVSLVGCVTRSGSLSGSRS